MVFQSKTGLQQRLLVKNPGPLSHPYTLTVACSGATSGCSAAPTSLTLLGGESRVVTVTYNTNTTASGLVKLFATQTDSTAGKDSGVVPIRTVASAYPVISLAANPGRTLARGLCLTIAAGSSAAYECGDLRIVHPLPGIRTLNRERRPMLLYNSGQAAPYPVLVAHVTLPSMPDSVKAVLLVNGARKDSGQWVGSDWTANATRQIAIGFDASGYSTNVYTYTLEVTSVVLGSYRHATSLTGKLIVVNRSASPFGAGWWLAGLESIVSQTDGSKLWVGGDGSARQYLPAGTNRWVASGVTRPDTLTWNGTYYIRVLASGDTVKFNSSGQHVLTVNRLGHQTSFTYSSGLLTTITLPSQGGSQQYAFAYTSNKLTTVTAPINGAQSRQVILTQSSGKVTQIKDPDNHTVAFGYSGNRITSRTDRRGNVTHYSYGVANALTRVRIDLSATDSIRLGFQWADSAGFFLDSLKRATDTASVYATFWDARQYATGANYVPQATRFWLDAFGAPRKIQDAQGHVTLLSRDDAQYRALVTRSRVPSGQVLKAGYDQRGNVLFTADSTHQNATTRYRWDARWNSPISIVPPMGDSTILRYDSTTGNLTLQYDARGGVSKTEFFYNSLKLLEYVEPAGQTSRYHYVYDTHGNLSDVWTPLGIRKRSLLDAIGRDTLARWPIGSGTIGQPADSASLRTTYDIMDRVLTTREAGPPVPYTNWRLLSDTAPADTLMVWNTYDAEGNPTTVARSAYQNGNLTTTQTSLFGYDAANRQVTVQHTGGKDSSVYDPAGNVVRRITARGDSITMVYDTLNRLIRRYVPPVDYAQTGCAFFGLGSGCGYQFPLYPNLNGTDLRIAARTDTFAYDSGGNLVKAWNDFAKVSRTYNLDGTLATDTLRIRYYLGTSFDTHKYGISYAYNLDGKLQTLTHPTNIDPANAVPQAHTYDTTGALATVTDVKGNLFKFFYDAQGRPDSVAYPGGWETYAYDDDGRLTTRSDVAGGQVLQSDGLWYDQRGMIAGTAGARWGADNVYSGLGKLVLFDETSNMNGAIEHANEYQPDGLGSSLWRRDKASSQDPEHHYEYQPGNGRLMSIVAFWPAGGGPQPADWFPDTTRNIYDAAGNVWFSWWRQRHQAAGDPDYLATQDRRMSGSFHSADGKLMFQQLYRDSISYYGNYLKKRGTWEEYWYDALGRRVLVRRRADSLCTGGSTYCQSTIERFVWAGDQLLYELRYLGGDNLSAGALNTVPPYAGSSQIGRVAYTHAEGIDAPLDLIRMDWGSEPVVILHKNWRGQYGAGTNTSGTDLDNTFNFEWPADFRGPYFQGDSWSDLGLADWFGSLIQDQEDQTGLMYKRNRYYDPNTGQFTQEDPIGLAGGLNLYGFAAGDPVSFSDPFGLCKPWPDCWFQGLANWGARNGGAVGTVALNVGAGLNAASEAFGSNNLGAAIGEGNVGGAALALATMLPVGKLGKLGKAARALPFAEELAGRVGRALDEIAVGIRRFEKDGTVFKNIERLLPERAEGYYMEYTVPGAGGERGAQRIVIGEGGEAYFTPDHYRTFVRIQQ